MKLSIEKFKDYVDDQFSLDQLEALADVVNDRLIILKTAIDKANHKRIKGFGMEEEAFIYESLRDWFKKEKWVRISSTGKIAGPCGTSKNKKNPDRCLPRAKAQSLSKAQRAATARKKKKAGAKGKTVVKNTKAAKVTRETANPQDGKAAPYGSGYKPIKKMKETKEAPAGHYFTKSGNLVKGRMSADAKERGARKSDPKDKQRSKVPKATQYNEEVVNTILEKCWKGYEKKGMKTMFGKSVPNCIKKEDVINLVTGIIHEMQVDEKKKKKDDRCTKRAKREYDTWPSAYASGAVVRCRRGKIWKKK